MIGAARPGGKGRTDMANPSALRAAVLGLLLVLSGGCGAGQPGPQADGLDAQAKAFVKLLARGDFEAAAARFDPTMAQALPAPKLQAVWQSLVAKVGPLKAMGDARREAVPGYEIVLVRCEFERAPLLAKVVFDPKGRITGLWFLPAEPPAWQPPPYVKPDSFGETEVKVGPADGPLPGTLTMPRGQGPFPALVLVHGSGPNDRDETLGPNRPFRDLAWGLASRGIAVLRYDKRTKVHPERFAAGQGGFTVNEETVDDAVAAAALLRAAQVIAPKRVFVLGHSLGGMLVPRIAARNPGIAGFVILAGATRPIEDAILAQTTYILAADGSLSEADQRKIDELKAIAAQVKGLKDPAARSPILLGAPPAYWLDLRGYDPAAAAAEVRRPMLVLQGGRDYQVTAKEDFAAWQRALAGRLDVTLRLYADLNHLFMRGEGPCTPAEYGVAGYVAEAVVADIADWIKRP